MLVQHSSKTDEWNTPKALYEGLNKEFNFNLDPCCRVDTAKCDLFYTINEDGLSKSWSNKRVFCNPPYSRNNLKYWVEKAHNEVLYNNCELVVMLIPSRTDTRYFHKFIYKIFEIRFIKGRIKFENGEDITNSAPFPSMLVIMEKINKELN